jgi:hypothetical protein
MPHNIENVQDFALNLCESNLLSITHAGERKKIPTDVEDAVVLFNQILN